MSTEIFTHWVEVDIIKDRCKVYHEAPLRLNILSSNSTIQMNEKNGNTEWIIPLRNTLSALLLGNYLVVVDIYFFLETSIYLPI